MGMGTVVVFEQVARTLRLLLVLPTQTTLSILVLLFLRNI
jgi:hypothetical protein